MELKEKDPRDLACIGGEPLTVGDVVRYMMLVKTYSDRGERTRMGRTTASVLRFYSMNDMADQVNASDFTSKRGAGYRAYWEFVLRYEELRERMRDSYASKVEQA